MTNHDHTPTGTPTPTIASMTTVSTEIEAMTARTQSFAYQPTRSALAARSLAAVDRIKDEDERREAFKQHLAKYPPLFSLV